MKQVSIGLVLLLVAVVGPLSVSDVLAQVKVGTTTQISISKNGGAPSGSSGSPAIGANGRHLVFGSTAEDLVVGDTNQHSDIFERDLKTKVLTIASVNSAGQQGDGDSGSASVSAVTTDGFYAIAFVSSATNLGSLTTSGQVTNIYVRMPTLGITEIVSTAPGFIAADGDSSSPSITVTSLSNGNKKVTVVFESSATNLISADNNDLNDVFVASFIAPKSKVYAPESLVTVSRVSAANTPGDEPTGSSGNPKISTDGRYVAYQSKATNLTTTEIGIGNINQIYRTDLETGATILISRSESGEPGDLDSFGPSINYNGRFVTYISDANNIIDNALPDSRSAFWFDTSDSETQRINESVDGLQGDGMPVSALVSQNGRFVGFADGSTNLVESDTNGVNDNFIKDMDGGEISRVSVGPGGQEADRGSSQPAIAATSFNGLDLMCTFASSASNLTSAPTASLSGNDIYLNVTQSPAPGLTKDSKLDVPPDILVKSKTIKLTSQKFVVAQPANTLILAASNMQIRYEFDVTRTSKSNGAKRTDRMKSVSKRNSLTIAKSGGSYSVRNRVIGVRLTDGKVVLKTPFSPRQKFKVS